MTIAQYHYWLDMARTFSRVSDDAEDLLQESLLIAFREKRIDFDKEDNRRWFTGVLKNRAAMMGRSAVRRRDREAQSAAAPPPAASSAGEDAGQLLPLLRALPLAARRTMALILAGLDRDEICSVLNLTDTALRQRLTTIRKALRALPDGERDDLLASAGRSPRPAEDELAFGLIRRALLRHLRGDTGVGSHDPDGHLLIFRPE